MLRPEDLSRAELIELVSQIRDGLYLGVTQNKRLFYDKDKVPSAAEIKKILGLFQNMRPEIGSRSQGFSLKFCCSECQLCWSEIKILDIKPAYNWEPQVAGACPECGGACYNMSEEPAYEVPDKVL